MLAPRLLEFLSFSRGAVQHVLALHDGVAAALPARRIAHAVIDACNAIGGDAHLVDLEVARMNASASQTALATLAATAAVMLVHSVGIEPQLAGTPSIEMYFATRAARAGELFR